MKNKIEIWKNKFRNKGIKCTRQRMAILEILLKSKYPLSAGEIHNQLKNNYSKLRLSTVYRNLNLFVDREIVRKISLNRDNRENKFELKNNNHHHHHLICLECGEIIPLSCPLKEFKEKIKSDTNYRLVDHNLKMYGICPECKKEK